MNDVGPQQSNAVWEGECRSWINHVVRLHYLTPEQVSSEQATSQGNSPLEATRAIGLTGNRELQAFSEWLQVPYWASLADQPPSAEFLARVPISYARQYAVLGFATTSEEMILALGSPESWSCLDVFRRLFRRSLRPVFVAGDILQAAINLAYSSQTGQTQKVLRQLGEERGLLAELSSLPPREDLLNTKERAPVIQLVNYLLSEAVSALASDIHVQPYEESLVVRMRIDGILFDHFTIPKHLQEEVLSRIKVLGKMNIAEKRLPQDGRATVEIGDRLIDLRIASLPTQHGERIVIRLLDKSARLYTLNELGMEQECLTRFQQLIRLEHGIVLVTGPTGSGKSTTLYAALRELNTRDLNVVTLEDPIEYQLAGISQTQINPKKGLTFASGLRSVLRQDPDIIMVGEIRDQETAVMAIQSSLTGHLVFSTLHTNDAASAVTRLLDLGIEPYLVASTLKGVLAQRLVRRVCPECASPTPLTPSEIQFLGSENITQETWYRGTGCKTCRETGYRGRFAISELLVTSEDLRERIQSRCHAAQILATARVSGMKLMREDGISKARTGKTTLEEIARVTMIV